MEINLALILYDFFILNFRYWVDFHGLQQFDKFDIVAFMREGSILLTRGYGFMGGVYNPPFWHIKKMYFCLWYELETLQVVRLAFLV